MQKEAEEQYYLQFEAFFDKYYKRGDISWVLWDSNEDRYYRYDDREGIYVPMLRQELYRIIREFFDSNSEKNLSKSHLQMIECCLQPLICNIEWDIPFFQDMQTTRYECLENGVLNLDTRELTPWAAEYRFRTKIKRKFLWDVQYEMKPEYSARWQKLLQAMDKPELFVNFLVCMVHKFFKNEQFLMMYGPRGTGKSTILSIPRNLFGEKNCGSSSIYQLASRFGLSAMFNKRVNINPDMMIDLIYKEVAATLKLLTGGEDGSDGLIPVEIKGKTTFYVKICTFLMFGINQLPSFSDKILSEVESIARRTVLIHVKEMVDRDPEFKSLVKEELFLDQIYSWLVYQTPKLTYTDDGETWIQTTLEEWYLDSDPLLRIIKDHFAYDSDGISLPTDKVYNVILNAMQEENLPIPKNLQAQITEKFKTMKIFKSKSHNKYYYQHINTLDREL